MQSLGFAPGAFDAPAAFRDDMLDGAEKRPAQEEIKEKNNDGRGYRGEEQITELFQNFHERVGTSAKIPCRHIFRTPKAGQNPTRPPWTHANKEKIYSIHTAFRQRPQRS
jgi:hypothetical protein